MGAHDRVDAIGTDQEITVHVRNGGT
jgi:hypothetical protein